GQALGLRWAELDLVGGMVRARHAVQRLEGELRTDEEAKTEDSALPRPLARLTVEAVRAHRERQEATGLRPLPTALVFPSTAGTALEPRNVNRAFDRLLNRAELRHVRLHDLRHSFGVMLLENGEHIRVVMELLGHSQLSETLKRYTKVRDQLQRDAIDRLDALLRGSTR